MQIELDLNKNIMQNAEIYFERSKKAKKKIDGINEAIFKAEKKLNSLKSQPVKTEAAAKAEQRKKEWYEKFRWFVSSEGFLVIGGRDATTNEIIIKKHTDSNDVVFHTDMAGSPFFVIKASSANDGKIGKITLQEAANATFTYSRAFKLGLATAKVFWVKPDQVSKEANAGEYLEKGAFVIRGKTNYISPEIDLAVGMTKDGAVMGGPAGAVKKNCERYAVLERGKEKISDTAKKIRQKIGGDLDDIIRAMPAGEVEIRK